MDPKFQTQFRIYNWVWKCRNRTVNVSSNAGTILMCILYTYNANQINIQLHFDTALNTNKYLLYIVYHIKTFILSAMFRYLRFILKRDTARSVPKQWLNINGCIHLNYKQSNWKQSWQLFKRSVSYYIWLWRKV